MSRWIKEFNAKSPRGSADPWRTGIPYGRFQKMSDACDMVSLFRLRLVEEVLENPSSISQGWSRPNTEECYIYCGKPERDYRGRGIDLPAPKEMSFIVCVLPDGEIDYWGWRPDGENDLPEGVQGA